MAIQAQNNREGLSIETAIAEGMRSPWIRRTFDGLIDGFSVLGSVRLEQQRGAAAAAAARCAVIATGGGSSIDADPKCWSGKRSDQRCTDRRAFFTGKYIRFILYFRTVWAHQPEASLEKTVAGNVKTAWVFILIPKQRCSHSRTVPGTR